MARPADYPATPTLDKMVGIQDKSQAIGEFVEWLRLNGIELCSYNDRASAYYPAGTGIHTLLHRFFEIDPVAEEAEKRAVLEWAEGAMLRWAEVQE
jgi:hypothetical protein